MNKFPSPGACATVRFFRWRISSEFLYIFLAGSIILGAFAFRLMGLRKGIWLDESVTRGILFSSDFLQSLKFHDHPPLYYLLLKPWSLINNSDIFLRFFSVFCGMGTVIALMVWIKQYSRPASLLAGLYAATLPLMLRYSQEIVDYSLFLLAVTLSFFYASFVLFSPLKRSGYVGLALSLTAVVLSHAVGIAMLPAVGIYLLAASLSKKEINRWKITFSFLIPIFFFAVIFLFLVHGARRNPDAWWVPPVSMDRLVHVSKSLFGLASSINSIGLLVFFFICVVLFFLGDWRRSWPLLAAAVFYWLALIVYSLRVVPVFLDRTALPGMIPFMGFVGLQIASIRRRVLRTFFIVLMVLSSLVSLFFWTRTAYKPIEQTQETTVFLDALREKRDIVLFFPEFVMGLFQHYAVLSSDSILSIETTDDVVVVDEKIGRMLKRQDPALASKPRSVFLVMRSNPLLKRNPETYLWLLKYLKSRFGEPVFYKEFGVFSLVQYKEGAS